MLLTKEICTVDVEIAEVGGEQAVQAPVGAQGTGTTPQHMLAFAVSIDTVRVLTLGLCEPQTLCRAEW